MKRYYLSKIVGTGSYDDPFDLAISRQFRQAGLRGNVSKLLPQNAQSGGWGMAIVATPDHTALVAHNDNDAVPDVSLDLKLSAIKPGTWTAFVARAGARGADISGFAATGNSSSAVRDVIRSLGQTLQPGFNEDSFDAAE